MAGELRGERGTGEATLVARRPGEARGTREAVLVVGKTKEVVSAIRDSGKGKK